MTEHKKCEASNVTEHKKYGRFDLTMQELPDYFEVSVRPVDDFNTFDSCDSCGESIDRGEQLFFDRDHEHHNLNDTHFCSLDCAKDYRRHESEC